MARKTDWKPLDGKRVLWKRHVWSGREVREAVVTEVPESGDYVKLGESWEKVESIECLEVLPYLKDEIEEEKKDG